MEISSELKYDDFELEIGIGSGREYPITVINSSAGEAHEMMHFPFDELALENRLLALKNALLTSGGKTRIIPLPEEQKVQDFGKELWNAMFTGEVRNRYDVSLERANREGKGLRLKLRIHDPKLATLPWEFMYEPRKHEYMCLSRSTSLVRYLELPQPVQPLAVEPPLRILGMAVSPTYLHPLDLAREKQRVEEAIKSLQANGLVQLIWLKGETWRDLQEAMQTGVWHIFYFIGHGGFDCNTDEGLIALADDEGKMQRFRATHLGRMLADHRSLRLVILNSCEGAKGSEHDIFSCTASILVQRGIPAVLAMQYEITDRAAIEFSRAFYKALANGLPVDSAVTEARKAVSFAIENTIEWGTPVLYMRSPDGVLFDIKKTQPADVPTVLIEGTSDTEALQRDIVQVPDIEKLNICAQQLYDVGKYSEALDKWNELLKLDPENKKALEGLDKNRLRREKEKKDQGLYTAQILPNWFVTNIVNASRSAKITGIFVIALIALFILGLPLLKPEPNEQQPSLSVSPDPLTLYLGNMSAGETTVRNFSISNTGQGTLKWNVSADQPWMIVNPINGTGSGTVRISINTTGLQTGTHSGIITVNSTGGSKDGKIYLELYQAPILKLSQTILELGTINKGEPKSKVFAISNVGGETLNWRLSTIESWIKINILDGFNNGTIFVTVDTSDLSPGYHSGTIMITSNGGNEQVTVKLNIQSQTSTPTPTIPTTTITTPTPTITTLPHTITNSIGMEFVLISAGIFDMGSPVTQPYNTDSERPAHPVNITKSFYLGKYEVTQKQWSDVMGTNPSNFTGFDDLPVERVSWDDAQQYIQKLKEKEGTSKYRLPSETEWEYAARAGTTTIYYFGDNESKLGDYAWCSFNSDNKTHQVGQKNPNAWGLYDIHGNVYEWVQDNYHSNYTGAPNDGSAWEGGVDHRRVLRSGSWKPDGHSCRTADRNADGPASRDSRWGFRLLMES